jgi:hypothetical protein
VRSVNLVGPWDEWIRGEIGDEIGDEIRDEIRTIAINALSFVND